MAITALNRSFHTSRYTYELSQKGNSSFGSADVSYEIYKMTDVSNLTVEKGYAVLVDYKFRIPNHSSYQPGPTPNFSYDSYPAIIKNSFSIEANNNATVRLHSFFPKTINSSVTTSESSSSGEQSSVRNTNSSGSTSSNVNTFGFSIGGGYFGIPFGDASLSYSHSWMHGSSSSHSHETSAAIHAEQSAANTMSVKDWSSYSNLGLDSKTINWFWAQSYPWDVLLYNQSRGNNVIDLPQFIQDRLLANGLVQPPSEISLFGLEFTNRAVWRVEFPDEITENEEVTITHTITNITASHFLKDNKITATLQSPLDAQISVKKSQPLDLSLYSLSVLGTDPASNIGTIGFNVDEFTYFPKDPQNKFKIVSPFNDLQVVGSGFDSPLTTTFKSAVTLTAYFKIKNRSYDYVLDLVHWVDIGTCTISWKVNDMYSGTFTISAEEQHKNRDNSSRISLRNIDHLSSNYHNFLKVGLNQIEITIQSNQQAGTATYNLSSISVG